VSGEGKSPVAIFCPTFLKPEMLHVYRQIAGLRRVLPVVLAFKQENSDRFPFPNIRLVRRSKFRWLRRFWNVQLRKIPQQAYRDEMDSIRHLMRDEQCELLHIYFGNNGLFWLPLLRNPPVPVIVSFHGADVRINLGSLTLKRLFVQMFDLCAVILARSNSLAVTLVELGCSPGKIRIQRAGIPLNIFHFIHRPKPEKEAWQLLQACRLIEKKGLNSTLHAFAAFSARHPHARLMIAGDGPLRDSLKRLAAKLAVAERVFFTGFVDQSTLLTLYESSHFFVHPSEQPPDGDREGIPNSLLEAMATGLPCITTVHGGIPEAVTHMESGILVKESDREGISQWLERLIGDDALRDSLGRGAAKAVAENFALAGQIAKLEDIYLDVASQSRRSTS
jgi:colanic acid/amylovoran biosynthesis glycosyltransferase